eukprot:jgi/Botrbrau1/7776/Bobra.0159s0204.1
MAPLIKDGLETSERYPMLIASYGRNALAYSPAGATVRRIQPHYLSRTSKSVPHLHRPSLHHWNRLLTTHVGTCSLGRGVTPTMSLQHQRQPLDSW